MTFKLRFLYVYKHLIFLKANVLMTSLLLKLRTIMFAVFVNNFKLKTFLNTTLNIVSKLYLKIISTVSE